MISEKSRGPTGSGRSNLFPMMVISILVDYIVVTVLAPVALLCRFPRPRHRMRFSCFITQVSWPNCVHVLALSRSSRSSVTPECARPSVTSTPSSTFACRRRAGCRSRRRYWFSRRTTQLARRLFSSLALALDLIVFFWLACEVCQRLCLLVTVLLSWLCRSVVLATLVFGSNDRIP